MCLLRRRIKRHGRVAVPYGHETSFHCRGGYQPPAACQKSPLAPSDEGAVTASAVTGGENKNVLSLSETSKNLLHFLSLRQKSKIFATSLIRGRLWRGAKSQLPYKFRFIELSISKAVKNSTPKKEPSLVLAVK